MLGMDSKVTYYYNVTCTLGDGIWSLPEYTRVFTSAGMTSPDAEALFNSVTEDLQHVTQQDLTAFFNRYDTGRLILYITDIKYINLLCTHVILQLLPAI